MLSETSLIAGLNGQDKGTSRSSDATRTADLQLHQKPWTGNPNGICTMQYFGPGLPARIFLPRSRRLAWLFSPLHLSWGDPASTMLGPRATLAIKAEFAERLGLDQPMPVQIVKYLGAVAQGDLGTDLRSRRPVSEVLMAHLPHWTCPVFVPRQVLV
ncbi:hypothetical protein ETW23_12130 [Leisingera sp. NJS201]|uniref:hypothetical protein n=1 Tax=Leisingera sp. NJS201 TaxID=2508306 RepID=UPI001070A230|nr:hypothetical protein [Leisingera sp. NJS201]QBR36773.1 hypothetical protein ETW23_12130 [Leisingera sp. NJS201]